MSGTTTVYWYYHRGHKIAHLWKSSPEDSWKPFPEVDENGPSHVWQTVCGKVCVSQHGFITRTHRYVEGDVKISKCKLCLKKASK